MDGAITMISDSAKKIEEDNISIEYVGVNRVSRRVDHRVPL